MAKKTIEERFHEKVWTEPMTGCWLWVGATLTFGYGYFRGWDSKMMGAQFGTEPQWALAERFQLSPQSVCDIKAGRTWKHIHDSL